MKSCYTHTGYKQLQAKITGYLFGRSVCIYYVSVLEGRSDYGRPQANSVMKVIHT